MKKCKGYWTKENCQKEALKYNSRKEFLDKYCDAYRSSVKNKWLDEICKHMGDKKK